eukprot:187804-Pelagomonas_calceolata.AAC.1
MPHLVHSLLHRDQIRVQLPIGQALGLHEGSGLLLLLCQRLGTVLLCSLEQLLILLILSWCDCGGASTSALSGSVKWAREQMMMPTETNTSVLRASRGISVN